MSTISKQTHIAKQPGLAVAIGMELKRRRTELGLSQALAGSPFTRSFVSSVERGRTIPSLPALLVLTEHLETSLSEFFVGVNRQMTVLYTPAHEGHQGPASRRGR
jgi:transcriptional regulator with XRE-family HTH domain